MPILKFYTNPGQLSEEEKQELATILTSRYAKIMPDFFVNIMFHELPGTSFFMAGKPTKGTFVRFTAEHIAVNWNQDVSAANQYLTFIGDLFKEKFEARGWTWEFSVTESRMELWRVQSLVPPLVGSGGMKLWMDGGKAVPWEDSKL